MKYCSWDSLLNYCRCSSRKGTQYSSTSLRNILEGKSSCRSCWREDSVPNKQYRKNQKSTRSSLYDTLQPQWYCFSNIPLQVCNWCLTIACDHLKSCRWGSHHYYCRYSRKTGKLSNSISWGKFWVDKCKDYCSSWSSARRQNKNLMRCTVNNPVDIFEPVWCCCRSILAKECICYCWALWSLMKSNSGTVLDYYTYSNHTDKTCK